MKKLYVVLLVVVPSLFGAGMAFADEPQDNQATLCKTAYDACMASCGKKDDNNSVVVLLCQLNCSIEELGCFAESSAKDAREYTKELKEGKDKIIESFSEKGGGKTKRDKCKSDYNQCLGNCSDDAPICNLICEISQSLCHTKEKVLRVISTAGK